MQKITQSFTFLLLFSTIMLSSCNQDNDCDGTLSIINVLPNSNPPRSEVRIIGDGLTGNPEIRFGGQLAKSEFTAEKGLIAIVPNNVSGLVDLTVEDGECLVRTEFEVLGTLPVNWVASPTVIVIPISPVNFPTNISNVWKNYYDNNHTFFFSQFNSCTFSTAQQDLDVSSTEKHTKNKFLNENPITGIYKCAGSLDIIVDRTKNGGILERYIGRIIAAATVGESNTDGKTYMLLTSQTGRQYVFFTP